MEYIKKFNGLYLLLLLVGLPLSAMQGWRGRAVPMAYNATTADWSVLFRLNPQSGFWEDFYLVSPGGQQANTVASHALQQQTKGVYATPIQGVPWEKTPTGDFVHFVPVQFIAGQQLFNNARNPSSNDFTWIPSKEILRNRGDIQRPSHGKSINVNRAVLNMMRTYLPNAVQKLSTPSPSPARPTAVTPRNSWLTIPSAVYFYERGKPYYSFTNFYESPITLKNTQWPTTEHYFQAQKFAGTPTENLIRTQPSARQAFEEARKHQPRADWESIKVNVMLAAVRAKMNQHPCIRKELIGTGDSILVEASPVDAYWGYGDQKRTIANGDGINALGQILMHVRKELKTNTQLPFTLHKTAAEYFKANQ